jgi:hypothetical protein
MDSSGKSKIKILMLYEILKKYSDEEHPLNSAELCEFLQERGIRAERKSVYRDISNSRFAIKKPFLASGYV